MTQKISVGKINSADDLMNLLKTTFEISEDIIGVTDTFGKFYDIQFVASHLTTLHLRKFNIVTVKAIPAGKQRQSKLDNGKHGSRNNFDKAILVGEKDEHCLGVICDLTSFGAAYRSK